MVFSVVEGEDKPLKYPVMFHSVDVILLNKIDLIPYSGVDLNLLLENVKKINPTAKIFQLSCKSNEGISEWVDWLTNKIAGWKKE